MSTDHLGSVLAAIVETIRDRETYTPESLDRAVAALDDYQADLLWQEAVGHAVDYVSDRLSDLGAVSE